MGTGAVYVTLSGLKSHSPALTTVETIFYFLNIILFLLNSTTLALQAIRKPAQSNMSAFSSYSSIYSVSKASLASAEGPRQGRLCTPHCTPIVYRSCYICVHNGGIRSSRSPPLSLAQLTMPCRPGMFIRGSSMTSFGKQIRRFF